MDYIHAALDKAGAPSGMFAQERIQWLYDENTRLRNENGLLKLAIRELAERTVNL